MSRLLNCVFAILLGTISSLACAQQNSFYTEDETRDGWYHSYDMATWVGKGGDEAVIQALLSRIENSAGARRHAELVDTQIEFGPGNWAWEWIQAGDSAMAAAANSQGQVRLQHLRAALTYYTTGSWPHLGRDDDMRALDKAVEAYIQAGAMLPVPVQHVEFAVGNTTTRGYLHLPSGPGPFPVVINSFGSDVTKEDSFDLFARELQHRGIAMLAVDMPGIGEARHLSMRDGSDQVMEGAYLWLTQSRFADPQHIFVVGGSFGGNAAARAFYRLDVAGVVSMCGPLHSAFMAPPEVLDGLPLLTIDGVKSRFGVLDQPTSALSAIVKNTSLVAQGLMTTDNTITTPLLVITTNRDPVAPLNDLELLVNTAVDSEVIVLDMEGHCPPRVVREPIIARWVADQINQ